MTEYIITIKPTVKYVEITGPAIDPANVDFIDYQQVTVDQPSTAEMIADQWIKSRKCPKTIEEQRAEVYKELADLDPQMYIELRTKILGHEEVARLLHHAEFDCD